MVEIGPSDELASATCGGYPRCHARRLVDADIAVESTMKQHDAHLDAFCANKSKPTPQAEASAFHAQTLSVMRFFITDESTK
jgi:hypothetical protein